MAIAEDGTSKIYTVNVYKTNLDENNYLQNLRIEFEDEYKIEPEFQKEIQEYKITLPRYYFYKNITIIGEPESAKAIVTGNGTYSYGNNINTRNTNPNYTDYPEEKEIILQVMSESGETRDYKVTISQEIDDNAYLSGINISNEEYALEFNKEILEYELEVKSVVEELTITGVPESLGAKVTGNGKKKLEYGENEIILNVVAEDDVTEKNYKIKITRKPQSDQSNYLISITTDQGELSPEFEKTTLHYDIEVPYEVTEINIDAVKEDERAILEGVGRYELNLGENNISLKVTTEEGGTRIYTICVNRNPSTESRLEALEVKNAILKPGFNMDTYEYSLTTTENSLDFTTIEPLDKNAQYVVSGNSFEKQGEYKVIIVVTAQDKKTTSRYILTVTKKENNNNNLASLEVYGYTIEPEFDKNIRNYTLTVENNVQTVVVGATPEEETSTVEGIGEIKLEVGINKVPVVVTSQTGKKKTYTIEITKKASSDNLIKELEVNNGTLNEEFQPEENNYTVNIPYSETSLDLSIVLNDPTATYEIIGNEDLKVGENEVKIVVTAQDGTENTYTLTVNRAKINSAYLEELKVKNYEIAPEFDKYKNKYIVKVNYETTSLDLTAIPEDKEATYVIEGNENFEVGTNKVTITVTSSLGDLKEIYEIEVERQKDVDNYLLMLYTSHGLLSPSFDKETLEYTVDVENSVSEIEIFVESSDPECKIEGAGKHALALGENKFYVKVSSKDLLERTYILTINRAKRHDNYLLSLVATTESYTHTIEPEFDKEHLEYTINVASDIHFVNLTGRISEGAIVEGLTEYAIYGKEVEAKIIVTSEAGETREYKVKIIRELDKNNHLTNIIPSSGTFTEEFMYEKTEYYLNLDEDVTELLFEVTTESVYASVKGNELQPVPKRRINKNDNSNSRKWRHKRIYNTYKQRSHKQ